MYNNFSDWYKKVLINTENKNKELWLKDLRIEDIFLEIITTIKWGLSEVFALYWINTKLTIEIINKWIINEKPEKRKWVYSWMNQNLKDVILWSVKIAASYSKSKATIEDFLLSTIKNWKWLPSFLEYIWINSSDLEKDLDILIKKGSIDWITNIKNIPKTDENIEKLFWALAENIFMWLQQNTEGADFLNQKQIWSNQNWKKGKSDTNTPALDFFSVDLTKEAKEWKIDKIIWRETEIERLIAILNRKTKNNPVLVWEAWVWKTAIVEWLAIKIASWQVPFSMKDKRILSLDISSLVAGTKFRWEFESRIKQVIEEASKVENEVILFIDEIHTIIWAWWSEWTLDASNILKPAMWRWKIRVIWATTLNEYSKYIEKDPALERRFQKILADEPNKEVAIDIITWLKETFEEYHNLNIKYEAITSAVNLSIRYITDRYLPDKAIDLIDEACSLKSLHYSYDEGEIKKLKEKIISLQKKIEKAVISQQYKKAITLKKDVEILENKIKDLKKKFRVPKEKRLNVSKEDIQKVLSITSWIPVSNLNKSDIEKLRKLKTNIKKNIIGQDEAIDAISKSIMRSKTWISNPNRPLWSFLFLWPTWVWKTEIVKILAKEFYWSNDNLIKIDMSEYSDKTSTSKLIWASAWYVWYDEWGFLTEKIRKKPYSIVLFDEIEKWDTEVYNLLLQILEDWILTDNKWRKINFKNTIIILTSNIWQEEFVNKAVSIWFDITDNQKKDIQEDYQKASENIINSLNNYFSPEFLNRIDKIMVFNPLTKVEIRKIVKLNLNDLTERLNKNNLSLKYDNKVINFITKNVYNPEFWAREIRRFLIDNIEDQIAEKIIKTKTKKDFKIEVEKNRINII